MADGEFDHVVLLVPQADEIIVDPRLILGRVVKVEILRLDVVRRQLLAFELRNLLEEFLLLRRRHAPDDHGPVVEQEHLGRMYLGVQVRVSFADLDRALGVGLGSARLGAWLGAELVMPRQISVIPDLDQLRASVRVTPDVLDLPVRVSSLLHRGGPGSPLQAVFRGVVRRLGVLVRGVEAFVEELRRRPSGPTSALEKLHQAIQFVRVRRAVGRHPGQAISIRLPQSRRISSRRRILDPRELRIDVPSALFVGTVIPRLGVRQQLQLLCRLGRPLRSNLRGEKRGRGK